LKIRTARDIEEIIAGSLEKWKVQSDYLLMLVESLVIQILSVSIVM
jgi:hypothetical protein